MFDLSDAKRHLGDEDRTKLDAALSSISSLRSKISRLAEPEAKFSSVDRNVQKLQNAVAELREELDKKKKLLGEEEIKLAELRQPFRESVAEIDIALKQIGDLFADLMGRYQVHVQSAMMIAAFNIWKKEFDRVQKEFRNNYGRYLEL